MDYSFCTGQSLQREPYITIQDGLEIKETQHILNYHFCTIFASLCVSFAQPWMIYAQCCSFLPCWVFILPNIGFCISSSDIFQRGSFISSPTENKRNLLTKLAKIDNSDIVFVWQYSVRDSTLSLKLRYFARFVVNERTFILKASS